MLPVVDSCFLLERVELAAPLLALVVRGDGLLHQLQYLRFAVHQPLDLILPYGVEELPEESHEENIQASKILLGCCRG